MTSVYGRIGSVSSGTLRNVDLIPAFISALEGIWNSLATSAPRSFDEQRQGVIESERITALLAKVEKHQEAEGYYDSEEAYFDSEELQMHLAEYAPPYCYFGTLEGDGADFGFWLDEGALSEFDGLRVSDLSEVPADYVGEVLHVNDHGNTTLYVANKGTFSAVWALV